MSYLVFIVISAGVNGMITVPETSAIAPSGSPLAHAAVPWRLSAVCPAGFRPAVAASRLYLRGKYRAVK